jgi:hypothetical protein
MNKKAHFFSNIRTSCLLAIAGAALAMTLQVGPASALNLVTNGDFEIGDFTGWAETGNTGFDGVTCGIGALQGNCDAHFGALGSDGGISQLINLIVGKTYFLSFLLSNEGGTPSDASVSMGGVTLLSLVNPPAFSSSLRFAFTATSASETLAFNFRQDPAFFHLDAVAIVLPEPGSMALLAVGFIALFTGLRRKA